MKHVWYLNINGAMYLYFKLPFPVLIFHFQAILHFVNQNMSTMGLQVADMDKQVNNS